MVSRAPRHTIRVRGVSVWAEPGLVPDFRVAVRIAGEVWPGELLEDDRPWPEAHNWRERIRQWKWRWHIWAHHDAIEKFLYRYVRAEAHGKVVPHPADPIVWPKVQYRPIPPVTKPEVTVMIRKSLWRLVKNPLKALALVLVVFSVFGNFGELGVVVFILASIATFFVILNGKR